jgi:hypothetical protein
LPLFLLALNLALNLALLAFALLDGLGLFFVMTAADILSNRPDILGDGDLFAFVGDTEEVIKILAEYLILFSVSSVYQPPQPASGAAALPDTGS